MKSVFVSYCSKDEAEVKKIVKVLADNNISYFKAPECIPPGSNYAKEIPKAIKECNVFLLIVSASSQDSVWVEKEIDCAINNRCIILPVQISSAPFNDLFSFYLNNVQIIRYYENPTAALIQLHIRLDMIIKDKKGGSPSVEPEPVNFSPAINSGKQPINYMPDDIEERETYSDAKIEEPVEAPDEYSRGLTPVEREIEQLRLRQQKKASQSSVKRFVGAGEDRSSVFKTNNNKIYSGYAPTRHADFAKRNNMMSVNKIPEKCVMCGGELVEVHVGIYRCTGCGYLNRSYFQLIRDCLAENGALNAIEISERTGVSRKVVEYFLLEEKLEIPVWSDIKISCQNCGAPINTGRYCDKCKRVVGNNLNNAKKSDEVGYRYIKTDKK